MEFFWECSDCAHLDDVICAPVRAPCQVQEVGQITSAPRHYWQTFMTSIPWKHVSRSVSAVRQTNWVLQGHKIDVNFVTYFLWNDDVIARCRSVTSHCTLAKIKIDHDELNRKLFSCFACGFSLQIMKNIPEKHCIHVRDEFCAKLFETFSTSLRLPYRDDAK